MTDSEIAHQIARRYGRQDGNHILNLRGAIVQAIRDEREECAKTAEGLFNGFHSPHEYSENVADAIRARKFKTQVS